MEHPQYYPEITEASYFKTLVAGFIDFIISAGILWAIYYYHSPAWLFDFLSSLAVNNVVILVIIHFIIRTLAILAFGRTPGMMFLGLLFLNGSMIKLTFKERLLASVFILYKGVDYYNRNWVINRRSL